MSFSAHLKGVGVSRMITLVLRLGLGGMFVYASLHKIIDPQDFAKSIYNYQILPDQLINLAALILPWLELFLGLALIGGVGALGAAACCHGLLWVFFLALVYNQVRGLNIHCGCFTNATLSAEGPPMAWYFLRDTSLLIASGVLLWLLAVRNASEKTLETS
jgi:uncharacterized membrane protein YphA (DoxX/SURF4 family)